MAYHSYILGERMGNQLKCRRYCRAKKNGVESHRSKMAKPCVVYCHLMFAIQSCHLTQQVIEIMHFTGNVMSHSRGCAFYVWQGQLDSAELTHTHKSKIKSQVSVWRWWKSMSLVVKVRVVCCKSNYSLAIDCLSVGTSTGLEFHRMIVILSVNLAHS